MKIGPKDKYLISFDMKKIFLWFFGTLWQTSWRQQDPPLNYHQLRGRWFQVREFVLQAVKWNQPSFNIALHSIFFAQTSSCDVGVSTMAFHFVCFATIRMFNILLNEKGLKISIYNCLQWFSISNEKSG